MSALSNQSLRPPELAASFILKFSARCRFLAQNGHGSRDSRGGWCRIERHGLKRDLPPLVGRVYDRSLEISFVKCDSLAAVAHCSEVYLFNALDRLRRVELFGS
jgi:hypothetical protein